MNNNWTFHKLSDISNPKQWQNLPVSALTDSGYLVYGANGIIGYYSDYNHENPVIAITCRGATCGNVLSTEPKSYITSNAMALDDVDESKIHLKFLLYALRKRGFQDVISGSAQPQITRTNLEKVQIPLPPSPEQIAIANILYQAEALIAKRKESLALLDAYLKSTFLEMFGDGKIKKHKLYALNDLKSGGNETFSNGPFGSDLLTSELKNEGVPVLYIRDIRNGKFNWRSNVFVTKEKANSLQNCLVEGEDVLIAKVGDPPGISAVYPKYLGNAIITQDLIRIRLNKQIVLPSFFTFLINSDKGKLLVKKISVEGTRKRFALGDFKKMQISIPPLELQNQFAAIVEKVEVLKEKYQKALGELENLYGSLSQRAFRGELGKED